MARQFAELINRVVQFLTQLQIEREQHKVELTVAPK